MKALSFSTHVISFKVMRLLLWPTKHCDRSKRTRMAIDFVTLFGTGTPMIHQTMTKICRAKIIIIYLPRIINKMACLRGLK